MKLIFALLLLLGVPVSTLAVTLHDDRSAWKAVLPNQLDHRYGGVGIVEDRAGSCTGTPITRWRVLTAAHCVGTRARRMRFVLPLRNREIRRGGRAVLYRGYHKRGGFEHERVPDAAIIKLKIPLPRRVPTYAVLDATSPPKGHAFEFVGYGDTGTGRSGVRFFHDFGVKRFARNELDRVSRSGLYFRADFDNGLDWFLSKNRFGSNGLGAMEGMIASGDSGGPAFYRQTLAARIMSREDPSLTFGKLFNRPLIMGVNSYTIDSNTSHIRGESSYGTIGGWSWSGGFVDWLEDIAPGVKVVDHAVVCPRGIGCGTTMSTAVPAPGEARATSGGVADASPAPVPLSGSLWFLAVGIGALGVSTLRRRIEPRSRRSALMRR